MTVDLALLILRAVVGLLFVGHGAQKLFGWFGGGGLHGTAEFMGSLGFHPTRFWALIVGLAEFFGGAFLALGLLTPIAAAAIIGVMLTAILRVHWPNGLWNTNNGFEYPLVLLVIALVLGLMHPGRYALDSVLNLALPMPQTFAIAVAVAVIGALVALIISGRRMVQPQPQQA